MERGIIVANQDSTDEQLLWKSWTESKDPQAGDLLMRKYIPLVNYHVQRIGAGIPKNISREELKSLGMMGLFDALNKFDYSRELKFDTYASFRVRGAIIDGLRKEDWLPRSSREKAKKLETKIEELEQKLMRHASAEEIAEFVEMPVEDVYHTVQEHFSPMYCQSMNSYKKVKNLKTNHMSFEMTLRKLLNNKWLNES